MREMTEAQRRALHFILKRDWPAGEPRAGWFSSPTLNALKSRGLIVERRGSGYRGLAKSDDPIIDLTPAGRAALAKDGEGIA